MVSQHVYSFEDRAIGVIIAQGEPYFRGNDLAKALGYANTSQAIEKNVNKEHIKMQNEFEHLQNTMGRPPAYISFAGFLELVNHSKNAKVNALKKWMLSEIMPKLLQSCNVSDGIATQLYRAQLTSCLDMLEHIDQHILHSESVEGDAIYIMQNSLLPNMVKIGRSIHPETRAKELSKSQPFQIIVCFQYDRYGSGKTCA